MSRAGSVRRSLDPRLLIGLALVVASVAGVVALLSAVDESVAVLAAGEDLSPGDRIQARDLVPVEVRLDAAARHYLLPGDLPAGGLVVTRSVGEGELVPVALRAPEGGFAFATPALRIDARAQALVALLGHSLRSGTIEALEAESLALTLVCRSIGPRTTTATRSTLSRRRLVDRVKLLLAADLNRRWSLAEIAAAIGGSAVYLTQAFQQVEGLPLYRYHLRLRLARALDLLPRCEDVSALALDLGFSSHSHFTAAFRQAYGRSPTAFRQAAMTRSA